jgi:hypothetical protein
MTTPRFSVSRARVAFASLVYERDLVDEAPTEMADDDEERDDASGVALRGDITIASPQDLGIANKLVNLGRKRVEN